jgi:hypothetical protein
MTIINDDIDTMISMLNKIKVNINNVDLNTQMIFINPIKTMILEAYLDSCNKQDSFLYPNLN